MNNKKIKLISFLSLSLLVFPFVSLADAVTETISNITTWIVTVSTGLAILMYTIGGFLWMSDAGNAEKSKIAKNIITSTTIGLVIILLAAGLTSIIKGFVD
ncbi:MAG: pilin [Candidatus Pacebacteria bacterium]|nr:pilin [Candidatus Paceibacterota bacterium]MDD4074123.1 pilin [Candidatus Paceibacterota bacterium]